MSDGKGSANLFLIKRERSKMHVEIRKKKEKKQASEDEKIMKQAEKS